MNRPLEPVSLHVTFESILTYADVTGDYNPIHVDKDFAARSPMGGVIAHGTMSLALLWQAFTKTFGGDVLDRIFLDVRFMRPVRVEDTVTSGGERRAASGNVYDIWVKNQNGENVIQGTATLRNRGEAEAAAARRGSC